MTRNSAALSLFVLVLCACQGPTEHKPAPAPSPAPSPSPVVVDKLGKYRQLTGSWWDSTTSDRYTLFESWRVEDDSTLVGKGYALAGKDTVFVEQLRLEVRDGRPTYLARIDSQNNGSWVPFQAQSHGPDSLIFENPGHVFPQCISYVRTGASTWDVLVTGTQNGVVREDRSRLVAR